MTNLSEKSGFVEFTCGDDFDFARIFGCGQCFRWRPDGCGGYIGAALGRAARVRQDGARISVSGTAAEFEAFWRGYFDLDRSYAALRRALCTDGYMRGCTEYGAGIRILRQEPWEALCTFILSQCNNIPRIRSITEALCARFGAWAEPRELGLRAFPSAERLAGLSEAELAPLRCGYRAGYVLGAARSVAEGRTDLRALARRSAPEAVAELRKLEGVGEKVASCAALYGLGLLDAFPVDVWMKKALRAHYPRGLDPKQFGGAAGLAQQYMFFYQRRGAEKS